MLSALADRVGSATVRNDFGFLGRLAPVPLSPTAVFRNWLALNRGLSPNSRGAREQSLANFRLPLAFTTLLTPILDGNHALSMSLVEPMSVSRVQL